MRQLLVAAGLCNNARLLPPNGDAPHWTVLGDPTEAALRVAALKGGVDLEAEALAARRAMRELPFDSRRKRMSTVHALDGAHLLYVKGAPKEVLALCTQVRQDGQAAPLAAAQRAQIVAINDDYARNGLRVLAVGMRELPAAAAPGSTTETYAPEVIEQELTFLGLIAMMDPPRPEVAQAVQQCHSAGIRIIMITGDYGLTAESIARRIGILRTAAPKVITGADLDALDEQALQESLRQEVVFARVAPEHKLRVVTALKAMGEIVAVTGDGVNDAPALKKADIGVAMGLTGTDVAKEAADMVLTDDNFASIVHAVEEGRAVYANIRKFMLYVITSNMPEAVPFMPCSSPRGAIPLALTVMQILAIDLGTDMVPAIGLGAEPPESRDHGATASLAGRAVAERQVAGQGALVVRHDSSRWPPCRPISTSTGSTGGPACRWRPVGTEVYRMATTMTLATVVATQIGAVMARRTNRASIFQIGFTTNRLILWGICGGVDAAGDPRLHPVPAADLQHGAPWAPGMGVRFCLDAGDPGGGRSDQGDLALAGAPGERNCRIHRRWRMRILIIGCGRVGAGLATTLAARGHAVAVVDTDPLAFEKLGDSVQG